ncbi:TPA: hypothetical protein ACIVL5_004364 [Salmonella enterica subsp. diarizonae serovar 61:r:-]
MRQTRRSAAIMALYAPQTRERAEHIRQLAGEPPFDVEGVAAVLYGGRGIQRANLDLYRSVLSTLNAMAKAGQLERIKVLEGRRGLSGNINRRVWRYGLPGTVQPSAVACARLTAG